MKSLLVSPPVIRDKALGEDRSLICEFWSKMDEQGFLCPQKALPQ